MSELTEKDFTMLRSTLKRWRNYAMSGTPLSLSVGAIDMLSAALDELDALYNTVPPTVHEVPVSPQAVRVLRPGDPTYVTVNLNDDLPTGEGVDESMTRRQLMDIAKQNNIPLPRNATKAQIIEAIRGYTTNG